MKLSIFTLVKDGMPWITFHYPEFRKLPFDWEWHVVEGTALPESCTSWCAAIPTGLSRDGTTEYLDSIAWDKRVRHHRWHSWKGKVSMCNHALQNIKEPCVLLEIDSDELWRRDQIASLMKMFESHPDGGTAHFHCRYFVGPDIVVASKNTFGNHDAYEWTRAWRFEPGMQFKSHEPPVLQGVKGGDFGHSDTEHYGLVFDHMAYATEAQIRFKQHYYGSKNNPSGHLYDNAVEGWGRLQRNDQWPAKLVDYLPFCQDETRVTRI